MNESPNTSHYCEFMATVTFERFEFSPEPLTVTDDDVCSVWKKRVSPFQYNYYFHLTHHKRLESFANNSIHILWVCIPHFHHEWKLCNRSSGLIKTLQISTFVCICVLLFFIYSSFIHSDVVRFSSVME